MSDKQEKGALGEDAVCAELIRRGHSIICRNYRKRFGEIDIISKSGRFIVFTEVKTRKYNSLISGAEAVNPAKQRKIILTADAYLSENPTDLQPRYDIAEVTVDRGKVARISIYEDAFSTDGVYTVN